MTTTATRYRVIALYKELHRLGRDYPDPSSVLYSNTALRLRCSCGGCDCAPQRAFLGGHGGARRAWRATLQTRANARYRLAQIQLQRPDATPVRKCATVDFSSKHSLTRTCRKQGSHRSCANRACAAAGGVHPRRCVPFDARHTPMVAETARQKHSRSTRCASTDI
jgi:hypothetical protein